MVRDFAKTEIEPFIEQMEAGEFPRDILTKMGELGLMGITAPDEYGGAEMDFTSYIIAIHELSKVSAVMGVILSVHTSVGTNPILYFGNDEQKKKYVPKLASGDYLGAFCLTEPSAGSDAGSLKTRAVRDGDSLCIRRCESIYYKWWRSRCVYRLCFNKSRSRLAWYFSIYR